MPDLDYAEIPEGEPTKASWARFSFLHMAQHRDYIRVAFQVYGASLTEYPLDPMDPQNMGAWAYHHQLMHDQLNAVLKIGGYNLQEIAFDDRANLQSWIDLHFDEHTRESTILGL